MLKIIFNTLFILAVGTSLILIAIILGGIVFDVEGERVVPYLRSLLASNCLTFLILAIDQGINHE